MKMVNYFFDFTQLPESMFLGYILEDRDFTYPYYNFKKKLVLKHGSRLGNFQINIYEFKINV